MGKLLIIKGADFSENALDKVVNPNNAVFQFGMEDANVFNTNMAEAANPTFMAANGSLNENLVGKTIVGFKIVSQAAGRSFNIAVYEYPEPESTTGVEISELTPLYEETFVTTKGAGEIEEFILTDFVKIVNANQRFSIQQNNAIKVHMGTYDDMVHYYRTSGGIWKYAQYNYMDKIFFDVKAVSESV
jgi:hypothetical protein